MAIPKQVEEAAELAEQLHSQMFNQEQNDATGQETHQATNTQVDTSTPDIDAELEELRKYKQRYETLKGKYDSEVPRLNHELQEFKEKVFTSLSEKIVQPQPAADVEDPRLAKWREEYGDEVIEMIDYFSKKTIEPVINEKLKTVQTKVDSVEDTQIGVAKTNFESFLDSSVKGDWRKLWNGEDDKFIEFLEQPDPSGLYTYGELADAYNKQWDGDKLARLLNIYLESNNLASGQEKTTPPEKKNAVKDALISPSKTVTNKTPAVDEPRIWTKAMMDEFQVNDRKGMYDAETSQAMWNDMLLAASQNRIRG